ncbi:MAG: SDR family NAD(P)-dependent oxidoreductase [Cellulophaga sp.]
MKSNKYTLITGASQGLGKAFAEFCAEKKHNLILISLPNESINILSKRLENKHLIDVIIFETDLTKKENISGLVNATKGLNINVLINNVGIGGAKKFTEVSLEYIDNMMLLNMRSLVALTHQLLPKLLDQNAGYILNVASLAAFSPIPFKTVYPASKAFVSSFSRGLNTELKKTNVHVSVAYPGGMTTNKEVSKRIDSQSKLVKLSILPVHKIAAICIEKLYRKKAIIIPGNVNRLSSILQRIVPLHIQLSIMSKKIQREL